MYGPCPLPSRQPADGRLGRVCTVYCVLCTASALCRPASQPMADWAVCVLCTVYCVRPLPSAVPPDSRWQTGPCVYCVVLCTVYCVRPLPSAVPSASRWQTGPCVYCVLCTVYGLCPLPSRQPAEPQRWGTAVSSVQPTLRRSRGRRVADRPEPRSRRPAGDPGRSDTSSPVVGVPRWSVQLVCRQEPAIAVTLAGVSAAPMGFNRNKLQGFNRIKLRRCRRQRRPGLCQLMEDSRRV